MTAGLNDIHGVASVVSAGKAALPSQAAASSQPGSTERRRLVVGVSGASGTPLALRLLRATAALEDVETHLVLTRGACLTASHELPSDVTFDDLCALADVVHDIGSVGDSIASGTFKTLGMVVVPCSMKTVAGIASGYSDNLLLRAADVTVKEGRQLVLVVRETPLSPIHLKNLAYLSTIPNVSVMPPMLEYYTRPETLEDVERHLVAKVLERFGIELPGFKRWS